MKKHVALTLIFILPCLFSSVSFGEKSLFQAVIEGNEASVKILLTEGAEVDARDEIGKDHSAIVKLLVENGANKNVVSKSDYTALILASAGGYAEIVDLLLEKGVDTSPKKNGLTAQQWAEKLDQHNVLKVFEKFSRKP